MKTYKNIYKNLLSLEKIKEIIILASKGKKKRREVKRVLNNLDFYANEILTMLKNKSFYMLPSHNKTILRVRNFKGINKKIKKIKKHCCKFQARSLISRIGWLKQTELGYLYYKKHIKNKIKMGRLKKLCSI